MNAAVVAIVLVVVIAVAAIVWHHKTRETDLGRIAAKADVKQISGALKSARANRDRAIGAAQKELNKAIKTRDSAIKRIEREITELKDPRGKRLGSYQGVTLYELQISTPHGSGALAGTSASVDSQVSKRITATRLVTIGVFALAAQKKSGSQFLSIDGPEVASVVQCPLDDAMKAREFAVKINNASKVAQSMMAERPAKLATAEKNLEQARDTTAIEGLRDRLTSVEQRTDLRSAIDDATAALGSAQRHFDSLAPSPNRASTTPGKADAVTNRVFPPAPSVESWLQDLTLSLSESETVSVLAAIVQSESSLDGLAVTNRRLLAFDSTTFRTTTPTVSVNWRSVSSVTWLPALSGKRLRVTTFAAKSIELGRVRTSDVALVKAAIDSALRDADIAVSGIWMDKAPLTPQGTPAAKNRSAEPPQSMRPVH